MRLAGLGRDLPMPAFPVTVVEIDEAALARHGPWPWPRERLARLVSAIADARPAALGIDLLLTGPDPRSPVEALIARGIAPDDPLAEAVKARMTDGDAAMRTALARLPVAMGIGLDPRPGKPATRSHFLATGPVSIERIWRAGGTLAPDVVLPPQAGLGVLALPADADGVVRRVPLLAEAAGILHPGLAAETLRIARDASAFIAAPDPDRLMIGDLSVRLPFDGLLRLAPGLDRQWPIRRIPAGDFLDGRGGDLAGHLVMLGASAPELGGLRQAADDVLTPGVLLQARALQQIMAGLSPVVPRQELLVTSGLALAVAGCLVVLPVLAAPFLATSLAVLLLVGLAGGLVALFAASGLLVNPLAPLLAGAAGFLTSAFVTFAMTRRQAARIRRRFEQHLSPDVVELIARNLKSPKLVGEKRLITALFTDIENFTGLTETAGPEMLVSLLDRYFEGVIAIVLRHGGTVDKIVGDAVHAFFNAPLDVPDHAGAALRCAEEILRWSDAYRQGQDAARLGFGRTRIGIESGEAIVGDVGVGSKLDYTAHGYAVNAAARLEAANKTFGTGICIGPGAAALLPPETLRPLGSIRLRGISGPAQTYSVWPAGADEAWKARYREAFALLPDDAAAAHARFTELGIAVPQA